MVVLAGGVTMPAVLLGLGFIWSGRWIARVEAERRAAVRATFTSVGHPARDEVVHLLLDADRETPTFAFACYEPDRGWIDPDTSLPIPEAVYGWQPHPLFPGRRRTVDHDRSTEDVVRELAALFPEDATDRGVEPRLPAEPSRHVEWPSADDNHRRRDGP